MTAGARSALTLLGLGLLLVVATLWGWAALTQPLPEDEAVPICESTPVTAGTEVRRDQVVVSVFNGSERSGLAGATMAQLTERGFVEGDLGDSPQQAKATQIWSSDPTDPAALLVQRQFKGAKIVDGDELGVGVVVVVGANFQTLKPKQVESVVVESDSSFCKATGSD